MNVNGLKQLILLMTFLYSFDGYSWLYRKGWSSKIGNKKLRYTIGADIGKTYFNASMNFVKIKPTKKKLDKKYNLKKELEFYYQQFKKSLNPKFILFQADYYPLTNFGIFLKRDLPKIYRRFDIDKEKTWNLVEIVGTKYKVPYQYSLFLGHLGPYYVMPEGNESISKGEVKKKKRPIQSGSSLSGLVFSFGGNRLIKLDKHANKWFNLSYKFKGINKTKSAKKSWTFESGYLQNENELFYDGISIYLKRDWASKHDSSFLANFLVEYRAIIPTNNKKSLRGPRKYTTFQEITLGRNFTNLNILGFKIKHLKIEGGMRWEVYKLNGDDSTEERNYYLLPSFSW